MMVLVKAFAIQLLSFVLPEEIIQDGFNKEQRAILGDLLFGCFVMAIIFLPQWCYRTKYYDEI